MVYEEHQGEIHNYRFLWFSFARNEDLCFWLKNMPRISNSYNPLENGWVEMWNSFHPFGSHDQVTFTQMLVWGIAKKKSCIQMDSTILKTESDSDQGLHSCNLFEVSRCPHKSKTHWHDTFIVCKWGCEQSWQLTRQLFSETTISTEACSCSTHGCCGITLKA